MLALRKSTVRSAPGNGDRRAPQSRLSMAAESALPLQSLAAQGIAAGQRLADSAVTQVANAYKHQAYRMINTYFSQRESLELFQALTCRVMALVPDQFSLHKDDAGGEADLMNLARLEEKTAEFFPEIARSVLESQLARLETGEQGALHLVQPVAAAADYNNQNRQPDLGEIDKLIKQILAMEVPVSTFPQAPSGRAD